MEGKGVEHAVGLLERKERMEAFKGETKLK